MLGCSCWLLGSDSNRCLLHSPAQVVWYLSGLTCTDDNFIQKAGGGLDMSPPGSSTAQS